LGAVEVDWSAHVANQGVARHTLRTIAVSIVLAVSVNAKSRVYAGAVLEDIPINTAPASSTIGVIGGTQNVGKGTSAIAYVVSADADSAGDADYGLAVGDVDSS